MPAQNEAAAAPIALVKHTPMTTAERLASAQAQANTLARQLVDEALAAMQTAAAALAELAKANKTLPPGVVDRAAKANVALTTEVQQINGLMDRVKV